MKKPVSLRAVEQRINRHLKKEDKQLCRSRRGVEATSLGERYIIDTQTNMVTESHIALKDLEEMAKSLNLMREWEEMV